MEKEWDVFVSYSTKDSIPVSHIVHDLRSSGLSIWHDISVIPPGSRIREAINEGIQGSKSFLVFLSKRSTRSPWVLNELDSAMMQEISNRRNFVVTALIGNISTNEIPADIQGKLFIDLRYNFQRKYLAQRMKLIQTMKLLSIGEQSKDGTIVVEIGKEFFHFLIDYKYVGYNEKFKLTEDQVNILAETLIIESMRKVWKSMSNTLNEFLTKFGSDMARRVATFAMDTSGVCFTKRFAYEDIYDIAGGAAVLMLSLLAAQKLQGTSYVLKAKWTPGSEMGFWMEK